MALQEQVVAVSEEFQEEELQEYVAYTAEHSLVRDEIAGEQLPAHLVHEAREEECALMEDWRVWEEAPVSECWRRTGRRPIGTPWVDVNKGDSRR